MKNFILKRKEWKIIMKSKFAKKFLSGAAALVVAASGSICGFAAEGSVDSPLLL